MPIEATEAMALMGYDLTKFETIDDLKAEIEKDWVKTSDAHLNKDIAGRIFGKQNNTLRSTLSKAGKDLGIEDIDFDKLDPIDGIKAMNEHFTATKAEWEKAKGDGSTSDEVAELKRQYDEANKAKKALKESLDATTLEYGEFKSTVAKEKESRKLEGIRSRGIKAVPFASSVSNLAKTGFDAIVRKEVLIAFDDEGNEYATDSEGKRIPDPSKAGTFYNYDQAVIAIAEREKLTEEEPEPKVIGKTISTLNNSNGRDAEKKEAPRQVRKLATR